MSDRIRAIEQANRAFAAWRAAHPRGRFHQYYAERVLASIDAGRAHPTLGPNLVRDDTENAGSFNMTLLQNHGLRPDHTCVDYGCGSLRVGRRLIEYLDPGRYWGLDITDHFFEIGRKLLGEDLVRNKQPQLLTLSDETLSRVRDANPDFITSNGVLQHVPPFELEEFLRSLTGLICRHTTGLVQAKLAPAQLQTSWSSWLYTAECLRSRLQSFGCSLAVVHSTPFQPKGFDVEGEDVWLEVRRVAS